MVDQIPMYRTQDGQVFDNANDAANHEAVINIDRDLGEFAEALATAGFTRGIKHQVSAIRRYLLWKGNYAPIQPPKKGE